MCKKQECLFGEIGNGERLLNDAGRMVVKESSAFPQRFPRGCPFPMVAGSLVNALKNNKGNDTTVDNDDPCDSVTSCNKNYPLGDEKPDDENIMRCASAMFAFRAGGWREAKMGDYHGPAEWMEILAFTGR
jgi:hypothetical protein